MKVLKVNLILLAVLCLLLPACSSIPKPTSLDNTMLVVHSIYDVETGSQRMLDFFLIMKDDTKYRLNFNKKENFTYITGLPPGIATTKLVRASLMAKATSTSGGRYFDYPIRVETKLEPECYTIFPATITFKETRGTGTGGTVGIGVYFEQISPAELRKLENQLDEMGINENWRKAGR